VSVRTELYDVGCVLAAIEVLIRLCRWYFVCCV